ncbi:hypothetical protein C5167_043794 [Papaver somniferum]|uniref:Uncharacterized protein n=1 Tax=Papaver somniferum TaxID=3469 RepID=A0A4Y7LAM2_PAPSO|nr:hypothetical protein C5167_043794 [Papaver somniferum]
MQQHPYINPRRDHHLTMFQSHRFAVGTCFSSIDNEEQCTMDKTGEPILWRPTFLDIFAVLDKGNEGNETDLADSDAMAVLAGNEEPLRHESPQCDLSRCCRKNEDASLTYMSHH